MPPYCAANSYGQSYDDHKATSPEEGAHQVATRKIVAPPGKAAPGEAFWNVSLDGQFMEGCQLGSSQPPPPPPQRSADLKLRRLHSSRSRRHPQEPFKFAGHLGTIVASLFASLSVLFIKLLPVEASIQEMAKASMYRGLFLALSCSIMICCRGESFVGPRGEYLINFVRAAMGALSTLLVYVAIEFITMGECSALVFSSPVWTCILGFIILKEPLPISLFLAVPMSFLGIILLADPDLLVFIRDELAVGLELQLNHSTNGPSTQLQESSFSTNPSLGNSSSFEPAWRDANLSPDEFNYEQRFIGICIALVASFFISGVIVSFKYRNTTSIATCSFQYGAALTIVAAAAQAVFGFGAFPSDCLEWALLLCIGVFSFGCQILFQWSLQYVPAGTFSVMRSLDIVLGFVLGAVFLNDVVLWTSVAGSVVIVAVVAMLMFNDYLRDAIKSLCCS